MVPPPEGDLNPEVRAVGHRTGVGVHALVAAGQVERHAPHGALHARVHVVRGHELPRPRDVLVSQGARLLARLDHEEAAVRPLRQVRGRRHHGHGVAAVGEGPARAQAVLLQDPAGEDDVLVGVPRVRVREVVRPQHHHLPKLHGHGQVARVLVEGPERERAALGAEARDEHQPVPPEDVEPLGGLLLGELRGVVRGPAGLVEQARGALATDEAKVRVEELVDLGCNLREGVVNPLEILAILPIRGLHDEGLHLSDRGRALRAQQPLHHQRGRRVEALLVRHVPRLHLRLLQHPPLQARAHDAEALQLDEVRDLRAEGLLRQVHVASLQILILRHRAARLRRDRHCSSALPNRRPPCSLAGPCKA
mmetsp:Transcript_90760/g.265672  ORF Transcript_90760/g.265672 Transcript_90760/m.265672 type:complete len:365 (-) Transcript_90760:2-1096(-)